MERAYSKAPPYRRGAILSDAQTDTRSEGADGGARGTEGGGARCKARNPIAGRGCEAPRGKTEAPSVVRTTPRRRAHRERGEARHDEHRASDAKHQPCHPQALRHPDAKGPPSTYRARHRTRYDAPPALSSPTASPEERQSEAAREKGFARIESAGDAFELGKRKYHNILVTTLRAACVYSSHGRRGRATARRDPAQTRQGPRHHAKGPAKRQARRKTRMEGFACQQTAPR